MAGLPWVAGGAMQSLAMAACRVGAPPGVMCGIGTAYPFVDPGALAGQENQ